MINLHVPNSSGVRPLVISKITINPITSESKPVVKEINPVYVTLMFDILSK